MGLDGGVGGLVHGGHTGAVELAGVPLDVALQGHRAHTGLEVEQPLQYHPTHVSLDAACSRALGAWLWLCIKHDPVSH